MMYPSRRLIRFRRKIEKQKHRHSCRNHLKQKNFMKNTDRMKWNSIFQIITSGIDFMCCCRIIQSTNPPTSEESENESSKRGTDNEQRYAAGFDCHRKHEKLILRTDDGRLRPRQNAINLEMCHHLFFGSVHSHLNLFVFHFIDSTFSYQMLIIVLLCVFFSFSSAFPCTCSFQTNEINLGNGRMKWRNSTLRLPRWKSRRKSN